MPGMVGPRSTTYHHGGYFWDEQSLAHSIRAREMIPNPDTGLQDTENYLITGDKYLSPGVRLVGRYKATTCGIRLKNRHGDIRITTANHDFLPKDANKSATTHDDERFGTLLAMMDSLALLRRGIKPKVLVYLSQSRVCRFVTAHTSMQKLHRSC